MKKKNTHHPSCSHVFSTLFLIVPALLVSSCAHKDYNNSGLEELVERQQKQHELLSEPVEKKTRTVAELEELGDRFIVQGDINRAYLYYMKGLETEPDNFSLRHKQAALLLQKNKLTQAEIVYKQLTANNDKDAIGYEGLGKIHIRQGKFVEAEQNLLTAVEIRPDLWKAHDCLGLVYSRKQDFQQAIHHFKTALSYKPDNKSALNNLAVTYYLAGNFEETIRILSNLPTNSKDNKIYNNLALAYFQRGYYNQALEAFKKGSENKAVAYNNIGHKYLASKKYTEAVESFKTAIDLHPKYYPSAQEGLELARRLSHNSNLLDQDS